ncbi:MAG: VOC family protein [Acidobacteriota bacterium]
MKLGYIIAYVSDISSEMDFFGRAFDLSTRWIHESGDYGELNTGQTTLAFASHALGALNLPAGYRRLDRSDQPIGLEIALVTESVEEVHERAVRCGAEEIARPATKPWGQIVSYVRSPQGILVELCTPIEKAADEETAG